MKRQIYRRFGKPGLIVLVLFSVGFFVLWNWETFKTRPFIADVIAWWSREPLPKADATRFSVGIAHLENDENAQYETLIFEALNEQFSSTEKNSIQILRFDRTMRRGGNDLEESVCAAHQEAGAYLQQSGADVLIWGAVLRAGGDSTPKLYWTTSRNVRRMKEWGRYPTKDLELPAVFWEDLVEILRLLVVAGHTEFRDLEGHFVADRLGPFIEKVRNLVAAGGRKGWTDDAKAQVQFVLANSLSTLGEQGGINEASAEAVDVYGELLKHWARERVPLDWAATQNNLGTALWSLGKGELGTERLNQAVAAYREALKERTQERVPLDWATTQNNLGAALSRLGEREPGTERLEEAVTAYREALKEYTRARTPLQWAMTQSNLGNALQRLGEREPGAERLEEALAAYRQALKEYTLGRAHRSIGQ